MKKYFNLFARVILPFLFVVACSRFVDEIEPTHAVEGTDGCVYCHTNKARLQVLAQQEETGGAGGG